MVGAMAKSLAKAGHQVGVVTPLYRGIREQFLEMRPLKSQWDFSLGSQKVEALVWVLEIEPGLMLYFVDCPKLFDRSFLYHENGFDYPDNAERFILFSKAVVYLARYLPWQPEVVHLHDWQVALVPLFIRHQQLTEGWGTAPRTCMTIHNLAYQGQFPRVQYDLTNLPTDYFRPEGVEFYGSLNCLKAGIVYADAVTTVSPRYAREVITPEFGCGLDGVLRSRHDALTGILNGVDYNEWKTVGNPFLPAAYDAHDLSGKAENKLALQRDLGLPAEPNVPLFGAITRLVEQKGVDIELEALEEMLAANIQFALLGSGHPLYETAFQQLARRYPAKAAVRIGYDHDLAHRIEAGADFYLMPSRFEPCGLNQMYSLRYGTIPIVRKIGGLDDSVIDLTEDVEQANGIKFVDYSAPALAKAIRKALVLYEDGDLLAHFRSNGMTTDFSWETTADAYLETYRKTLKSAF